MTRSAMVAVAAALVPGTAAAQAGDPDPSRSTAWHNQQSIALASLQPGDGWQSLPGGLRWRRVAGDGSGQHPTLADIVTLHYAGTLIDGTKFDSSYGRRPATFPLRSLIRAWQMAVPEMGVGDTIEIAAPADLAYGPLGGGPIPGGATLLFKIELLGIQAR